MGWHTSRPSFHKTENETVRIWKRREKFLDHKVFHTNFGTSLRRDNGIMVMTQLKREEEKAGSMETHYYFYGASLHMKAHVYH